MNPAIRLTQGPLGSGHPPVSRALAGDVVSPTQNLLSIYDEFLADVRGQTERQGDDIAHRAALLRAQLDRRVVGELQCDVHSFALPSLVAYLGQSVRLYLHGFYDAAIMEATSRLSATLRGRLLSLAVWNRLPKWRWFNSKKCSIHLPPAAWHGPGVLQSFAAAHGRQSNQ